jgi:antitoxin component YwqK of YwqJK toxin-antitoxin module
MVSNYTQAQKQKTDLSEVNLLGQVQLVSHIEYSFNTNKDTFVQEASFLSTFNTKGYTLQVKHYNRDLRLDYKVIFEYDKNDRLTQSKKYTIYEELDSSLASKDISTYYAEEKKTVLDHYNATGDLKAKTTWREGIVETLRYDPDGAVKITNIQKFNKRGQNTSEETYIVKGVLRARATFKNFKKKIIIKRYNKEGKLSSKSIQKLDAHGNIISWDFPALKKQKIYTYKYDKQNNWIEKITYKKGKPSSKIERTIDYH